MGIHDREHLEVKTIKTLQSWLRKNHETSQGLWVVTYKKSSGISSPSYDDIVKTALTFGWIDSVPGKVDDLRSKLYLSPRKPKSVWSQSNKKRVAELLKSGEMHAAGLKSIEVAKANGSWETIDSAQKLEVPDDLAKAMKKWSGSRKNFDAFPPGVRKQILEWIALAKTQATRDKRILETAELAAQNIRANQWRDKKKS